MAHSRFLWNNLYAAPATTLVASSATTPLPIGASQNPDRTYVWRSASVAADVTIDIDLGSVQAVTCWALVNVVVTGACTEVRLYQRGDAGSAGASTLVDTLTLATDYHATRKTGARFFASQSHRHWQIRFQRNSGSITAEMGYAFVGPYYEPGRPVIPPITAPISQPSVVQRAPSGGRDVISRPMFDRLMLRWPALTEADLVLMETMVRTVGVGTPLLFVLNTNRLWTCWMSFVMTGDVGREVIKGNQYNVSLDLEEAV